MCFNAALFLTKKAFAFSYFGQFVSCFFADIDHLHPCCSLSYLCNPPCCLEARGAGIRFLLTAVQDWITKEIVCPGGDRGAWLSVLM